MLPPANRPSHGNGHQSRPFSLLLSGSVKAADTSRPRAHLQGGDYQAGRRGFRGPIARTAEQRCRLPWNSQTGSDGAVPGPIRMLAHRLVAG